MLRCKGPWQPDGPELPLEFARTARDGRLTLVLLSTAELIRTVWTEVDYASAEQAQAALAGREGSDLQAIGLWPGSPPKHSVGAGAVAAWAKAKGVDAVVWSALRPKFNDVEGEAPADAAAAVRYLRQLSPEALRRARDYVIRAPAHTQTGFREQIISAMNWDSETT